MHDIAESVRHLASAIAKDLSKMARLRLLDTEAYADEVNAKKIRARKKNTAGQPTTKSQLRKAKRRLCSYKKQNDILRADVCHVYYCMQINSHVNI